MRIVAVVLFTLVNISLFGGELVLQGVYRGKDIYVKNPYNPQDNNFCTLKVFVNDRIVVETPRASAFRIDLSDLSPGSLVVIRIEFRDGCQPSVINPQVLQQDKGFRFLSTRATNNSVDWSAEGEDPEAMYIVEQEVFDRDSSKIWKVYREVIAKGELGLNIYAIPSNNYPGENKYRIKYAPTSGESVYSVNILYTSTDDPVTFYPSTVTTRINLSRSVYYEISDRNGKLLRSGNGNVIQLQDLRPGEYYLLIENRIERFVKK